MNFIKDEFSDRELEIINDYFDIKDTIKLIAECSDNPKYKRYKYTEELLTSIDTEVTKFMNNELPTEEELQYTRKWLNHYYYSLVYSDTPIHELNEVEVLCEKLGVDLSKEIGDIPTPSEQEFIKKESTNIEGQLDKLLDKGGMDG